MKDTRKLFKKDLANSANRREAKAISLNVASFLLKNSCLVVFRKWPQYSRIWDNKKRGLKENEQNRSRLRAPYFCGPFLVFVVPTNWEPEKGYL